MHDTIGLRACMSSPVGSMQHHELTVEGFLDHAARWHPRAGVVTATGAGTAFASYPDLRHRAGRMAAAFSRMGIGHGDMVATLGWNTGGHFETWYAAAGIGAVCHTLNPRLPPEQLAAMIAQSRPRLLLYGAGLKDLAAALAATAPTPLPVLALDGEGEASVARTIDREEQDGPWGVAREGDPAGLCFTSGTTGDPKGVLYTHRSNYLHTLRLLQSDALGLGAEDRVLAAVPMFHANGWGLPFAAPAGGRRWCCLGGSSAVPVLCG